MAEIAPRALIKHALKGGTLYREDAGIIGRCICGWSTGHRFSSFIASIAIRDHLEEKSKHEEG